MNKFTSKGEAICKKVLEAIFEKEFVSKRPKWLINPLTKRCLELDCYNKELNIALEYNGIQHYKWPNFTGQSYKEYLDQNRRDIYKKQVCKKRGIFFIEVPYTIKKNKIQEFIKNELTKK